MNSKLLVSVCCITYNHEKFLAQCIESVLMQEGDFELEFVIGEDCSTDRTREVLKAYELKYPEIIRPIYYSVNQGAIKNSLTALASCSGKYIALVEGDDYWIDPLKIQKQLDFMEANAEFSMCFTDAEVVNDTGIEFEPMFADVKRDILSMEDFVISDKVFAPTATLFFRNILPKPAPTFQTVATNGDIAIHLLLADLGKVKYIRGKTAVYRHHFGGVTKSDEHKARVDERLFKLYVDANEYFEFKYDSIFRRCLLEMSKTRLIWGSRNLNGFTKLRYVVANCKYYFRYSNHVNLKEVVYYTVLLFLPGILKLRRN